MEVEKLNITEHEFNIILSMKWDKGFCAKMCASLKRKHFNSKLMGYIFEIAKTQFQKFGDFPSKTTLAGWLSRAGEDPDRFNPILDSMENESAYQELTVGDKRFIEDEVLTFAKHARMKEAIIESYDLLEENKFSEINTKIQDALKFNIDIDLGIDLFNISERYARLSSVLNEKITSGFTNLDEKISGGWSRKEIYCVLGPPGMGKSIFLPNFGRSALFAGYNVVHYSFEMSEERVGLRYDGPIANLKLSELVNKIDTVKKAYELKKKTGKTGRLFIKEFPTAAASVLDIESHLEQLRTYENFVPDVIIVDYGDIMKSAHKSDRAYEEQGWIFRELRGLAIEYNCVVLTATQARRDALGKNGGTTATVGMEQVADSMEKNRILDGLFSIVQTPVEKTQNIINLYIAKNRNGPSSENIQFKISYEKMMLTGIDKETKDRKGQKDDIPDDEEDEDDYFARKMKAGTQNITSDDLSNKYGPSVESKNITAEIKEDE